MQDSDDARQTLIRERAYGLWEAHGCPGRPDRAYWELATLLETGKDDIGKVLENLRHEFEAGRESELFDRLSAPRGRNVSTGKVASTSSASSFTKIGLIEDASNATTAEVAPGYTFHTRDEQQPWWSVDLGEVTAIERVRIYNRTDTCSERFNHFEISVSAENETWQRVFVKDDSRFVGGFIGGPFVWIPRHSVEARYLRISLLGFGCLHLNRVEVYGCPD